MTEVTQILCHLWSSVESPNGPNDNCRPTLAGWQGGLRRVKRAAARGRREDVGAGRNRSHRYNGVKNPRYDNQIEQDPVVGCLEKKNVIQAKHPGCLSAGIPSLNETDESYR